MCTICNHCASSCTQENDVKMMAKCIQLDMECAAICYAAAQLMSLGSEHAKELCRLCADICEVCGNECSKHHTEHCQECAEACKRCAEEWQLNNFIKKADLVRIFHLKNFKNGTG